MARLSVVAAAIVESGRVLAAHRRQPIGWEFPGGKVEPGEAPDAAIARECLEELGVHVRVVRRLGITRDQRMELALWQVIITAGAPVAGADHDELRWLDRVELDDLDWLPADRELLPAVRAAQPLSRSGPIRHAD